MRLNYNKFTVFLFWWFNFWDWCCVGNVVVWDSVFWYLLFFAACWSTLFWVSVYLLIVNELFWQHYLFLNQSIKHFFEFGGFLFTIVWESLPPIYQRLQDNSDKRIAHLLSSRK